MHRLRDKQVGVRRATKVSLEPTQRESAWRLQALLV
jgi:hypothetical protein